MHRDPRVCVLLDHWHDDWTQLWWLRLDGRARVVAGGDVELTAIDRALRAKYPRYAAPPIFAGPPTLLEIEAVRMTSWSA